MSRQTNGPRAASPKLPQSLPNVSSPASHVLTDPNLAPFVNLSPEDVNIIDSIILRAGPEAISWIAVVKAYNDVFQDLGKEAADDVDIYTILLKLGLIRASDWGERWSHVKNVLGMVSSPVFSGAGPQQPVPSSSIGSYSPPAIPLRLQKTEGDTFTLHSRISGSTSVVPNPKSEQEKRPARTRATRPTTREGVPKRPPSPLFALTNPKLPKVTHPPSQISDETAPISTAFTTAKPPSYRTHAHERDVPLSSILPVSSSAPKLHPISGTRPAHKSRLTDIRNRDMPSTSHFSKLATRSQPVPPRKPKKSEEETWRKIELRQKADAFRYEKLVGACFDVWYGGMRWLEERENAATLARNDLVLRSVIDKWRQCASGHLELHRKALKVDQMRLLHATLKSWQHAAWTRRRKRWADQLRGQMVEMGRRVDHRILNEALKHWVLVRRVKTASLFHEENLLRRTLVTWRHKVQRVSELKTRGELVVQVMDEVLLKRAFEKWKRRLRLRALEVATAECVSSRVARECLIRWNALANKSAVAREFRTRSVLGNALRIWFGRLGRILELEQRAVQRPNQLLARTTLHIWRTNTKGVHLERMKRTNTALYTLSSWRGRLEKIRTNEGKALSFQRRSDKVLVDAALRIWASALVRQIQADKAAFKLYNTNLAERVITTWRSNIQAKRRLTKQAKLVRRLFLERTTWRKWKYAIDAKRREEKLQEFEKKRLKAAWRVWVYKARKARNDRRKEEAVSVTISTRIMRRAFGTWMVKVLFTKNREYDVKLGYQEKLTSAALVKWHTKFRHHQENTSLMQSFVDVRHEEGLRRLLWVWVAATRRKRLLTDREEELRRSRLLRAWESWRDRYIENGLRNIEMDVVLQSHTNLLFKTFRVWEAKATTLPAVRFRARHAKLRVWKKWRAAMPLALKAKEAREYDRHKVHEKVLLHWQERYKAKIAQKAIARARYLRLPPAPLKSGPSRPLGKFVAPKSHRSTSPEISARRSLEEAVKTRIGSSRAASPGPSSRGIRLLDRSRPLLASGLASRIGQSEREGTVSSVGTRLSNEFRGVITERRPRFSTGLYRDRGRPKTAHEAS